MKPSEPASTEFGAASNSKLAAVAQCAFATFTGAVRATKHPAASLDTVTDDFASTTIAFRRHHMDSTFEAVENMRSAVASDLESLVVLVSAMFAFWHKGFAPVNVRRFLAVRCHSKIRWIEAIENVPAT